jgi:hypothetical protein
MAPEHSPALESRKRVEKQRRRSRLEMLNGSFDGGDGRCESA